MAPASGCTAPEGYLLSLVLPRHNSTLEEPVTGERSRPANSTCAAGISTMLDRLVPRAWAAALLARGTVRPAEAPFVMCLESTLLMSSGVRGTFGLWNLPWPCAPELR